MSDITEIQPPVPPGASEALTIRLATPADAGALRRLAQLDSAPPPKPVPMLVAEVDGELQAAMPIAGGPAIADPFRSTAGLVAMLATRARRFEARAPEPVRGRGGLIDLLRPATRS